MEAYNESKHEKKLAKMRERYAKESPQVRERRRARAREAYAQMSSEKKAELLRRRRENYARNKHLNIDTSTSSGREINQTEADIMSEIGTDMGSHHQRQHAEKIRRMREKYAQEIPQVREHRLAKAREAYAKMSAEKKANLLRRRREIYATNKQQKTAPSTDSRREMDPSGPHRIFEIGSSSQSCTLSPKTLRKTIPKEKGARASYTTMNRAKDKVIQQQRREVFDLSRVPTEPFTFEECTLCEHCGAKKMIFEPPGFCCSSGEIRLSETAIPEDLFELFTSREEYAVQFRQCIRTYNNTFAFTSLGVTYDKNLSKRNQGIYTFKVQGQMHHYISSLFPTKEPSHLQLYFFDTEHELENRLNKSSRLREDVVTKLMKILENNPYSQFFRSLGQTEHVEEKTIFLKSNPKVDQRVYNLPTSSQVAGIWIEGDNNNAPCERDIIVHSHSGAKYRINYYYGCYDPLQYPLLFPFGDAGWHQGIPKVNKQSKRWRRVAVTMPSCFTNVEEFLANEEKELQRKQSRTRSVSCREYYCYKLQLRPSTPSLILISGRLLQQYIIDMYIKIESSRLDYIRNEQESIRADLYQGIMDCISRGEHRGSQAGRIILPSSFIGGPRDMTRRYLDALALVQKYGKPDIFLTMTCNSSWPEIRRELLPGEEQQNRPDLVARVFRAKLEELKTDLLKRNVFEKVAAYVYVVEYQKRGLLHVHFLLILDKKDKITTPDMFDKFVLAEIPDEKENPHLFRTVVHHMMHGPCGKLNENNPCMREKACKNHYPREFCSTTSQARNSYPIYRRRNTGITVKVRGAELDNRWVVPYNPYLLAKYDCHLNVEICSTVKAVKYLYKYVYKGHDRVLFEVNNDCDTHQIDEIRQFQSARWISPPEAAWRIFQFHMNEMYPSVKSLQLHLEGMHTIGFHSDQDLNDIAKSERATRSMLTEYFRRNLVDHNARQYYYKEFPEHYVWDETNRLWLPRKRGEAIGRIVAANPAEGERYYLRCLLNHVKGATSYEDLRTVNGVQCNTFREAAEKLGLLEKDNSIDLCMEEAVSFQMPCSLRRLFATLLVFCAPQNPQALWQKFKDELCEDFKRTTTDYYKKALQSINMFLESMGKTLADFNLPESPETYKEKTRREIQDELNVPITDDDLATITNLNSEQKEAFDVIMLAIRNEKGGAFFIDGPGGSGKTYLYRALLTEVCRKGGIALACASTGVAASILPGG